MSGDMAMMQLASETSLHPSFRLYGAVIARANKDGHAAFAPNELSAILVGRDGQPASDKKRRAAINSLKSAKVIAPNSTSLCIVIDAHLNQRADRSDRVCKEPAHARCDQLKWLSDYGYEPSPGYWRDLLSNSAPGEARVTHCSITAAESHCLPRSHRSGTLTAPHGGSGSGTVNSSPLARHTV